LVVLIFFRFGIVIPAAAALGRGSEESHRHTNKKPLPKVLLWRLAISSLAVGPSLDLAASPSVLPPWKFTDTKFVPIRDGQKNGRNVSWISSTTDGAAVQAFAWRQSRMQKNCAPQLWPAGL
jgi:hypothetical protein